LSYELTIPNNAITGSQEQGSFALLLAAGYGGRSA
jgi:hypothetical protein